MGVHTYFDICIKSLHEEIDKWTDSTSNRIMIHSISETAITFQFSSFYNGNMSKESIDPNIENFKEILVAREEQKLTPEGHLNVINDLAAFQTCILA